MSVCLLFQSTPLHLAAGYNRVKTVKLLLHHGADVHAKDKGYFYLFPSFIAELIEILKGNQFQIYL